MVQNKEKHSKNSDLIIHFLASLGVSEQAREQVSSVSKQANGQASGPVLTYGFLIIKNYCGMGQTKKLAFDEKHRFQKTHHRKRVPLPRSSP